MSQTQEPQPQAASAAADASTQETLKRCQLELAHYRTLVEEQSSLVVHVDAQQRILYASPAYGALFDCDVRAIIGQSYTPEIHPDDQASTLASVASLQQPPHLSHLEQRCLTKRGWRWLRWSNRALLDANGRLQSIIGVAQDITELKDAQQTLLRQAATMQTMLEHLPLGIYMLDTQGRRLIANRTAEEILGRPTVDEQPLSDLNKVYRVLRSGTNTLYPNEELPIVRGLAGEASHVDDLEIERPDGRRTRLEVFGTPVRDLDGNIWASLVSFIDITERSTFAQQLLQTQKLESLGVLAGGIAHDFNNILMAILGHAELAQRKLPPLSPAHDNLVGIETASRRAAELCRQMLAYAGKASFSCEHLALGDLVDEMAYLLKASISKKAVLNVRCERDLTPIHADPSQIRQILLNLIVNASDALGESSGVITVTVGATHCDEEYLSNLALGEDLAPGIYVHLEVADTGCGMDVSTRERIFEPFFSTKFTGRGLGLAAVLGIVKAHRGAIKVYSEPGKGSTFKLLFPMLEAASVAKPALEPGVAWTGRGHILLADDEANLRAVGALLLEDLGFSVTLAEDGEHAVQQFRAAAGTFSAVILDLTMPHLDGAGACSQIRSISPQTPIILASGYAREDVAARFAGKSIAGVLQKPYTIDELTKVLANIPALGS